MLPGSQPGGAQQRDEECRLRNGVTDALVERLLRRRVVEARGEAEGDAVADEIVDAHGAGAFRVEAERSGGQASVSICCDMPCKSSLSCTKASLARRAGARGLAISCRLAPRNAGRKVTISVPRPDATTGLAVVASPVGSAAQDLDAARRAQIESRAAAVQRAAQRMLGLGAPVDGRSRCGRRRRRHSPRR